MTETRLQIPNNWKCRPYQVASWNAYRAGIKRQLLIWHRRAGKDEIALNKTVVAAHERIGNYWHCLPKYEQARKAIWEAVNPHTGMRRIDEAFPPALRTRTDNVGMVIELANGSIWRIVGSDNPDSLVGAPPVGIVFSEWALSNPSAWAYLAPALAENGGWADFITTPRGKNHVHAMWNMAKDNPSWFAQILTVNETGFPLDRVEEQRREYHAIYGTEVGDSLIEQEYFCFKADTPIWTNQGQRPIAQIAVGDTVLSHAGRWRKVTRLYQHEHSGEMIEIHSAGSPKPLVCTPNHQVRICNPNTQEYKWVQAGMVEAGQYVVMPRLKAPSCGVLSAEMVELIGWFIAEGSVSKTLVQFTLNKTEVAAAERIAEIGARFGKVIHHPSKETGAQNVVINSTWLADFLVSSCGSGAKAKRVPWHLIGGHERLLYETLIEGDGCRGDYGGVRDIFTTISHSLALDVQMLAHMLGLRAAINFRPKEKAAQSIQGRAVKISDAYSVRVAVIRKNIKYYGEHTKAEILPQKHGVAAKIRSVKRVNYSGTVHNLGVQFDESYVADGRVVHNCSFNAATLGSYYGKALERAEAAGKLGNALYDPELPVYTAWDLGISDQTVIWLFQVYSDQLRVIDCIYGTGKNLEQYCNELKAKPYRYADDYVPHDARVRDLGTGRTRLETLKGLNRKPKLVVRHAVEDGINALRVTIEGNCLWDKRCEAGIEALKQYHAEWDDERKMFSATPYHDWTSDFADAARYMALAWREVKATSATRKAPATMGFITNETGTLISNYGVQDFLKAKKRRASAERY